MLQPMIYALIAVGFVGLCVGLNWLRDRPTIARIVKDYLWLFGGLLCVWIGMIGVYVIHSTGSPSSPSILLFVAPFCFYRFAKARLVHGQKRLDY